MGESRLLAFVDESVLAEQQIYMFGAVLVLDSLVDVVRQSVAELKWRAQAKIHWRDEPEWRRSEIVAALERLSFEGLLVVRVSQSKERPERQRRKCMASLLPELERRHIDVVAIESRARADNERDRKMAAHLRANRSLNSGLHLSHMPGPEDPMLWIADVMCGAYGAAMLGNNEYLDRFQETHELTLIEFCDGEESGTDGTRQL